ncbi:AEC family transporter [Herbiconiux sp. KACC 21604]|uniref:AEC family transporter n=1 Tax=unclassified Herbiconiux TaxID=2618217 RepID=UPI0014927627|nr:AEC family transporter [Herbiconiux sp. SALV-R1]QJU55365.1 AEC family transporter [Herbiconiux sp. SALV-R1]WPO86536.1 AEC family transporter [Herbiconiux sp. KACC 21604]
MLGVLTGFGIIGFVIAVGYLVQRLGFLPGNSIRVMNQVAFFVATPALLFTVLSRSHPADVFSGPMAVTALIVAFGAAVFVAASRLWFRRPVAETTIGAASSVYVNANNIGLPVATYVLGNAQFVAPLLLLQLVVMAPLVLGTLDIATSGRASIGRILTQPLRNPMIIASALGLAIAVAGVRLPDAVFAPFELIGGAAIPLVLLSFGMSLVGQRPLQAGTGRAEIVVASVIKLLLMPISAYVLGRFVFGLAGHELFVVVALATLPTAQNIYNFASRYQRGIVIARDTVLLTTIGSVPMLLLVAALLA